MRIRSSGPRLALRRVTACLLLSASVAALGCQDFRECRVPEGSTAQLPARLSDTGLYDDIVTGTLASSVREFTPRFPLWSDGAEKQRFVALPEGTRIDSSDMDDWQFPEGTKLWKQFTRDGVRVETRLEQKIGPEPADWALVGYVWDQDETDAVRTEGGEPDARGTSHDVPRAADCLGCHGGRKSRVLGFSAVQLSAAGQLARLIDEGVMSDPPDRELEIPGSAEQIAGLGYLHANCGHCHNQIRPDVEGPRCYDPQRDFELVLRVSDLRSVKTSSAVRTGVGHVIDVGDVDDSKILKRMRARDPDLPSMPPLGTELVDEVGVAAVRAFVRSLGE